MPNPNDQVDASTELTPEEEFDLEQAELIAAAGGKTTDDGAGAAAAAALDPIEAEASRKGWRPKDKYEGDPTKWVDAKTFIERGERFASNLQKEVATLKAKLESFEGTRAAFIKHQSEVMKAKDEELSAVLKQLRVQRSEAQADGDHEGAVALEDRMEVIRKDREQVAAELKATCRCCYCLC